MSCRLLYLVGQLGPVVQKDNFCIKEYSRRLGILV
jgi:hypothetical protein